MRPPEQVQSVEQQARDIEPMLKQAGWALSLGAIAAVIEALDTMYGPPAHEPSEQPQYRKWPGEPPHCMSCDCGMTDEQKRTVPEADYLRVHKELMDLKYPQQGASRDASPRSNDWADAKGGLPDNKL